MLMEKRRARRAELGKVQKEYTERGKVPKIASNYGMISC
jgi:hypothetical protein